MAQESVTLDPSEFCPNRAELSLHEAGLEVRQEGADWGEAAITEQLVRQDIGATVSDLHLEPVDMTIPLRVREEVGTTLAAAAQPIQQKIGLYQRERGGWIRRDFATEGGFAGSVGYQILSASMPGLQGWLFAHEQVQPEVLLKAKRHPLAYATVEAESGVFESEAGLRHLIFELASVLGTHPGLIRVRVKNSGEDDWRALILAGESRDLAQDETKDTTAAMAYDCADLTPKGGATVKTVEGIKVVEHASLTAGWLSLLNSQIATSELHMTHIGVRRVWIRAEAPEGEAEDVQLKLRWRPLGAVSWSENTIVPLAIVGDYQLYDLGGARPEPAAIGDQRWEWEILARAVSGSGKVRLHIVYPFPTEQFMLVKAPTVIQAADSASSKSPGTMAEANSGPGGAKWTNPTKIASSDNAYATAEPEPSIATEFLKATNFGFALKAESAISQIVVGVKGKTSVFEAFIHAFKVNSAGTILGDYPEGNTEKKLVTTEGIVYFEPWKGALPSIAEVNDADFGLALLFFNSTISKMTISIDHVQIHIYYTEASDPNRVCFATRSIELRSDGIYRQHPTDDIWGQVIPEGFLPYSSPSGMEERASRFIIVPSQGDLGELADSGDNSLSAQEFDRPAFLYTRESV